MTKKKRRYKDPLFIITLWALTFIGIFMIASSSYPEGITKFNDGLHFLKRHLIFVVIGIFTYQVTSRVPSIMIRKLSFLMFLFSLGLCLLLYTSLGVDHWGQVRWLRVPGTGFEFMPSDLIKFTSVFYLSDFLLRHRKELGTFVGFLKVIAIIGLSVGPIIPKDFSTGVVIGAALLSVYFLVGIRRYQWLFLGGIGTALVYAMLTMERFAYRKERLLSFTDPFNDIADTDWQLHYALYALGIGGFYGQGPFQSRLKQGYLPLCYNDFIFPIIGEEWGFIGTAVIVILFGILCWRGLYFAIKTEDLYDKFIATGITVSISVQAFFNMGVSMGILPVTGLPLPFISYGGTSLIVTFAAIGVLAGISGRLKGVKE